MYEPERLTLAVPGRQKPVPADKGVVLHGIGVNWQQFALLLAVTAFIGGMAGLERTVVPLLAQREFGIASAAAATSFLASFGLAKALSNLFAGRLSARFSRRRLLIAGWLFALPVPLTIIWAPAWGWIVAANALLGVQQGLTWSMTVNMHVDLAGPRRRGLALGLNETAGYVGVAGAAFLTGVIAGEWGVRPEPFYLGVAFSTAGLALAALAVRDTQQIVATEARPVRSGSASPAPARSLPRAISRFTFGLDELKATSLAGFVNNLNDGMAWALLPIFLASREVPLSQIAVVAAAYPLVWGALQTPAGWASDRIGRWGPIVAGMLLQGAAIVWLGVADSFGGWLLGAIALGAGTALVYPTLLAAVSDAVSPEERPTALGIYRFWRDSGTLAGALLAGLLADLFGFVSAIETVGAVTATAGIIAAWLANRAGQATHKRTAEGF